MFIVAVAWPDLSSATRPGTAARAPGLKLLASKSDVRAWPGGFGYAKVGANYGPSFVSQMEGRKMGYDQILWLLGSDFQVRIATTLVSFEKQGQHRTVLIILCFRSRKQERATSSWSGRPKKEISNSSQHP